MKTDKDLQSDVLAELRWEPSVNAAHIGVGANEGIVTLTGHVPSYSEKFGAERAAKRVLGVRAVANELDVKLPGVSTRTDEDIATACANALRTSTSVPDDTIKVVVRGGFVALEGEVEWQYQKNAAETAVRDLVGVVSVGNSITVRPHASPGDVKHSIEAAFRRNAEIDARRISVGIRDGNVILSGTVHSWMEREEAQRAAWAAPGVTGVDNEITIMS